MIEGVIDPGEPGEGSAGPGGLIDRIAGSSGRSRRYPLLDGLRVVAMFGVLAVHADTSARANTSGIIHDLAKRGDAAVPLFLMMSGFLLFRPMVLAHIDDKPVPAIGPYLARRLLRIYPGYWVVLAILVAIDGVDLSGFREFFLAATLLYPLFESPFTQSNFLGLGQTWVVVLLFQIYALVPVLGLLARRVLPPVDSDGSRLAARNSATNQLLGWCALLGFIGLAARSVLSFGTWTQEIRLVVLLPVWLDVVAPGLALAVVVAAHERGAPLPRVLAWIQRWPLVGWLGALGAYLIVARLAVPDLIGALEPEYSLRYLLYSIVASLALATAVLATPTKGLVARLLASRAMWLLSLLSVGFFVAHLAIMGRVEKWLDYEPFRAEFLPLIAVTVPLSLAVAAIAYIVAERPTAAWSNRFFRR